MSDALSDFEEDDPASVDFALVENSANSDVIDDFLELDDEVGRALEEPSVDDVPPQVPSSTGLEQRETKPHNVVPTGNERETKPHDAVDANAGQQLRETARQPAAKRSLFDELWDDGLLLDDDSEEVSGSADQPSDIAAPDEAFDSEPTNEPAGDSGSHSFVDEATRRSDHLKDMLAAQSVMRGSATSTSDDTHTPAPPRVADDQDDEDDEFDFDLGFENPASRIEVPSSPPPRAEEAEVSPPPESQADDEDDFDFDLGFENPADKATGPGRLGAGSVESSTSSGGFDFGFDDDEDLADDAPMPSESRAGGGRLSGGSTEDSQERSHRDLQETPASMPSIPRFRSPTEENTSPAEAKDAGSSLDDDEFFELAESLAGDGSSSGGSQGPYRGEPLMTKTPAPSATPTPTPTPTPLPADGLSEVSAGRQRADTPNPFAHEAPTGVQQALVDSNSSFVLEEIRESEVQEDEAAVAALMSEARRLYEKGKFESAHDLLESLLAREDAPEEGRELMTAVEGELERLHQSRLGSLSKIPELNVTMSDIPSMNLDHRFGYLLSQIDGMSSFEDILELSSMSRLETLEVLSQMLQRDIISVA